VRSSWVDDVSKVIGNDGAGTVVEVGRKVKRFQVGDRVYAYTMDGGFYAEYVASRRTTRSTPPSMDAVEAGALGADGITACGARRSLKIAAGQRLMISEPRRHRTPGRAARQANGAQVFAIASGADGVDLVSARRRCRRGRAQGRRPSKRPDGLRQRGSTRRRLDEREGIGDAWRS